MRSRFIGWMAVVCVVALAGLLLATGGTFAQSAKDIPQSDLGNPATGGLDIKKNEVERASQRSVRYPRANYFWPFASGPYYGRVVTQSKREPGVLHTQVGSFQLNAGSLPIPQRLTSTARVPQRGGARYFVVQVHRDVMDQESFNQVFAAIEQNGGQVIKPMAVSALLARLTPEAHGALQDQVGLIAIEPWHGAFKLDPSIGRTPLPDRVKAISEIYTLEISIFRGEDPSTVAQQVKAIGGNVLKTMEDRVVADVHYSKLGEIAALDAVYMIHEELPIYPHAIETTTGIQTGAYYRTDPTRGSTPYHDAGIRGAGQILMVLDSGISLDAPDLSNTETSPGTAGPGHRKVVFYGPTNPYSGQGDGLGCDAPAQGGFSHGHMVTSVAIGNADFSAGGGTRFLAKDNNTPANFWENTGVAPDAKAAVYDARITPAIGSCGDPLLGLLNVGNLYDPGPVQGSMDHAYELFGARVYNFSWGSDSNAYTTNSSDIDTFLNDQKDAMVFISAGNNGQDSDDDDITDPGSVGTPATAKNAVSVGSHGAVDDDGNPGNANEKAAFSSVGPVGNTQRTAPILMAPGQERGTMGVSSEWSCRSNDNDQDGPVFVPNPAEPNLCDIISGQGGTSFSSPAAAGAGLLVRSYFGQGFYPDGTDGNPGNGSDLVSNISGSLIKSVLIASADFLGTNFNGVEAGSDNLTRRERFNNEQGYGKIQLDNALPLTNWADSPQGLIVADGGIPGGVNDLGGTISGVIGTGGDHSATFQVCDAEEELRIALSWVELEGDALVHDLNLEVISPSGDVYYGNYFTDDDNKDGVIQVAPDCIPTVRCEDCPSTFNDGTPLDGGLDQSEWSLPICTRADGTLPPRDDTNPTEAVMLSPNPDGTTTPEGDPIFADGTCVGGGNAGAACGNDVECDSNDCDGGTNQIEVGTWTVRVFTASTIPAAGQRYSVAIAGGVCLGSSVRINDNSYVCNDTLEITVNEVEDDDDLLSGIDASEISNRTVAEVLAANVCDNGVTPCSTEADCDVCGGDFRGAGMTNGTPDAADGTACNARIVVDQEGGFSFGQPDPAADKYVSTEIGLTDGTSYDPGNGVLDVRDGTTVRVRYLDETSGSADADKERSNSASVACKVQISFGDIVFVQLGQDTSFLVVGGCERNVRGLFESGFSGGFRGGAGSAPDRYMDEGETISYQFAFGSNEQSDLENATVALRCVYTDADSPGDCRPGTADCPDPDRDNNEACDQTGTNPAMNILDSPKTIGLIPAGAGLSVNYTIQMEGTIFGGTPPSATPKVEMLLEVRGSASGKTAKALAVNRHRLNVDEVSLFYSTDFPGGFAGGEDRDRNNNGIMENPTSIVGDPTLREDYVFETRVWSDLTACTSSGGASEDCNTGLQSPWSFDTSDGGFRSGLNSTTDESAEDLGIGVILSQWGEDKNFNNQLDGRCEINPSQPCSLFPNDVLNCGATDPTCIHLEDRDPTNLPTALLDQNWSTNGGCGWTTRAPGTCTLDANRGCYNNDDCTNPAAGTCNTAAGQNTGGVWKSGRISTPDAGGPGVCMVAGNDPGPCQLIEALGGTSGQLTWWELLTTPVIEKVNKQLDADGDAVYQAEILDWSWNQAVDMPDDNVAWSWELDTDTESLEPVDLFSDGNVLNLGFGGYGAVAAESNPALTRGWSLFAPMNARDEVTENGTLGGNRQGQNPCFFEGGSILTSNLAFIGTPRPDDDDAQEGFCLRDIDGDSVAAEIGRPCTHVCEFSTITVCNPAQPDGQPGSCFQNCVGDPAAGNNIKEGFCENNVGFACDTVFDCDFGDCLDIACNGACIAGRCDTTNLACTDNDDCIGSCQFSNTDIDDFVTVNGPIRNMNIFAFNGPDMRFFTLEDLYGDTGNSFQGAIGFLNFEADSSPEATSGFGVGVDDMVIEWREFRLDEDTTDCLSGDPGNPLSGGGSCATINIQTSTVYEGNALVTITVTDSSPSPNDCDGDGTPDFPDDFDCDNDLTNDVVVTVQSEAEITGERVILNNTGGASFVGTIPVSSSYDVPGTLYLASQGVDDPNVTAIYFDRDDGTGQVCKNSLDPNAHGRIPVTVGVTLGEGDLVVTKNRIIDVTGDSDRIADDSETVDIFVTVANKTGVELTGVNLRLLGLDSSVDCVERPSVFLGNLGVGEEKETPTAFRFRVGNLGRGTVEEVKNVNLKVLAECDQFDNTLAPQLISLVGDLNFQGGSLPTTYNEGFEGGFGTFTTMHIDEPLNPPDDDATNWPLGLANADGFRCQYNDPGWENSITFGTSSGEDCFPNPDSAPDQLYWDVTTERAFAGTASMHWGIFISPTQGYTTPAAQLEAVRTDDPVNLGWDDVCSVTRTQNCDTNADCTVAGGCAACIGGETCVPVAPELSWKHQVSLMDHRTVNAPPGAASTRGAVSIQLADIDGNPVGDWIKVSPFVNVYDTQSADNYFNCLFDPTDDGSTEDDFFDPSDPGRTIGPSTTCFPQFSFSDQGHTTLFGANQLGDASDGPGLPGGAADGGIGVGGGTWIEPKVNLEGFRGQRLRLRYLVAGIKVGGLPNWEAAFMINTEGPDPRDDGWFFDDVRVTDALINAAEIVVDTNDNSALANACTTPCTTVNAVLDVDPAAVTFPGQPVELDASGSNTAFCVSGVLQYQFIKDGSVLRDWTDNDTIIDVPEAGISSTTYEVNVRCSAGNGDPLCEGNATQDVPVSCPDSGKSDLVLMASDANGAAAGGKELRCDGPASLAAWGGLASLSATYAPNTLIELDAADAEVVIDLSALPDDTWVLVKGACNVDFWNNRGRCDDGSACRNAGDCSAGSCTNGRVPDRNAAVALP